MDTLSAVAATAPHRFACLTEHVWWLSPYSATDRPTLGVIVGTRATLVVDTGNSPAHAGVLRNAIRDAGLPAPTFAALTHWHWDHVFGGAVLNLCTFGHQETRRIVSEMAGLDWSDAALDQRVEEGSEIAFCRDIIRVELPDRADLVIRPPDIAFDTPVEIGLGGGVVCRLIPVGGDHAPDSVAIHVPGDGVAFLGDCIYPALYGGPRRYTTATLFPLLDRVWELGADYYITGHDPAPLSRAQLKTEYVDWLRRIGEAVERHRDTRDRARILADLEQLTGAPVDQDTRDGVEEFLAGLESTGK